VMLRRPWRRDLAIKVLMLTLLLAAPLLANAQTRQPTSEAVNSQTSAAPSALNNEKEDATKQGAQPTQANSGAGVAEQSQADKNQQNLRAGEARTQENALENTEESADESADEQAQQKEPTQEQVDVKRDESETSAPERFIPPKKPKLKANTGLNNAPIMRQIPKFPQVHANPKPAPRASREQDKAQDFEPRELLLSSIDMKSALAAARQLKRYQLSIKSRQKLNNLDFVISVFRLPENSDTLALLRKIRGELPELVTDTNQRYQLLSSNRKTYAQRMVKWPSAKALACTNSSELHIGMIDTAVNTKHPALANAKLHSQNFFEVTNEVSVHGTAIASLFIGKPESQFAGLIPSARLFAANVFRQRGDISDTNTEALLNALNWLISEEVSVINLSLGGKQNRIFDMALQRTMALNISVVAAAGNQGPNSPAVYPAAQEGVIAVTAVDANGALYTNANRGEYIDFAAPGVDVWAADAANSGRYHTGTSFAAPFVTAALALTKNKTPNAIERLKQKALDKGPEGRDSEFGWGLIELQNPCVP
jgi:minor extracellular protease Epr